MPITYHRPSPRIKPTTSLGKTKGPHYLKPLTVPYPTAHQQRREPPRTNNIRQKQSISVPLSSHERRGSADSSLLLPKCHRVLLLHANTKRIPPFPSPSSPRHDISLLPSVHHFLCSSPSLSTCRPPLSRDRWARRAASQSQPIHTMSLGAEQDPRSLTDQVAHDIFELGSRGGNRRRPRTLLTAAAVALELACCMISLAASLSLSSCKGG
ncbi:hypothetical protein N657DRAFT_271086 [Parathielavia appendiculata]|uniref:Uncharacterized protein n=1 Tax=Parathielavia appendiculata TaxID=2587402 RepID=A0AAN6U3L9_9PEZI|nr:hypothetical protein N657DRAFT_271086 [Parathielavia appendiculata]